MAALAPLAPSFLPPPPAGAPTDPPEGVRLGFEYKSTLIGKEANYMAALRDAWLLMEARLAPAMFDFAQGLERELAKNPNLTITQERLLSDPAFAALYREARSEVDTYTRSAAGTIQDFRLEAADLGRLYGRDSLAPLGRDLAQADIGDFGALPAPSTPATPTTTSGVRALLTPARAEALAGLGLAILGTLAAGQLFQKMRAGLGAGFDRVLTTARTEAFRSYRDGGREVWSRNGVLWYARAAQHDTRVCSGCLLSEGETYPVNTALDEHPNGRCVLIPMETPHPPADWLYGEAWFVAQEPEVQMEILGPGKYDAWQAGAFELSQAWRRTFTPSWGAAIQPTPLKDLAPGFDRRRRRS